MLYSPEEDSWLMKDVIKRINLSLKEKVLDMGAGTGIQGEMFLKRGLPKKNVFFADISNEAIKYLKKKFSGSKIIQSDLFSKVKGKFNLIVFNPPYLPEDSREPEDSRLSTTGGKHGSEIINEFIKQSKKHLAKKGKIYLLTSSLTRGISWKSYKKKIVARKKIFFEELMVWELN